MPKLPPYRPGRCLRWICQRTPPKSIYQVMALRRDQSKRRTQQPLFVRRKLLPILGKQGYPCHNRGQQSFNSRCINPYAHLCCLAATVSQRSIPYISITQQVLILKATLSSPRTSLQKSSHNSQREHTKKRKKKKQNLDSLPQTSYLTVKVP